MKKVLITGGCGFIGSHLSELMVKQGYEVVVFDKYNRDNHRGWLENSEFKKYIKFILGDIRDYDLVFKAAKNCDIILHLAALIGIPYSYMTPLAYIKTNIEGTYNVLEVAKNLKVKKIIVTSTSEVYGSAKYIPIDEKHELQPQSPYSASKIAADNLALSYYHSYNLPVNIIRPFNTYGPRQSQRAIIPTLIKQIMQIKKNGIIKVGNIYPKREFNYVDDVCLAFLKSINLSKYGQTINIGNGFDISIKQLIILLSKIMNKKVKFKISKDRVRPSKSEVSRLCASYKKANKLIKWSPNYKKLEGLKLGLKKTVEWNYKNNSHFDKSYTV